MRSHPIDRFAAVAKVFRDASRYWVMLAVAAALVWCAGAKAPDQVVARPAIGIPYTGLGAQQLKALVGTTVDVVPRTGKPTKSATLVKVDFDKKSGALKSIAFKVDKGRAHALRADELGRIVAGGVSYDVFPQNDGLLLVDMAQRDDQVQAHLATTKRSLWPMLTDAQQEESLAANKAFLTTVDAAFPGQSFQLVETNYYLFYTDIAAAKVTSVIADLDNMYLKLGQEFGVYEGENIWRGKAVIVAFEAKEAFEAFETNVMKSSSANYQGIFHARKNGYVLMTAHAGHDPSAFAAVLAYETARGYMWRFRSNVRVPQWISAGVAEWAAASVLPTNRGTRLRQAKAVATARATGNLGSFVNSDRLDGWQKGAAFGITDLLVKTDALAYRAMILGIKEGVPWQDSLRNSFALTPEGLSQLYGQTIGVPNLQP